MYKRNQTPISGHGHDMMMSTIQTNHSRNTMNKSALAKKESPMLMSPIKHNLPPMPSLSLA